MAAFGFMGHVSNGGDQLRRSMMPADVRAVFPDVEFERSLTWEGVDETGLAFEHNAPMRILLIGDSHSKDLFNAFRTNVDLFAGSAQVSRLAFDHNCIAERYIDGEVRSRTCRRSFSALSAAAAVSQADAILIAPRWNQKTFPHLADFVRELRYMSGGDAVIAFVGRTAEFGNPLRLVMREIPKGVSGEGLEEALAASRDTALDGLNDSLSTLAANQGVLFLDKASLVCRPTRERCALMSEDGKIFFYDYGHWTLEGARYFGTRIHAEGWIDSLETLIGRSISR